MENLYFDRYIEKEPNEEDQHISNIKSIHLDNYVQNGRFPHAIHRSRLGIRSILKFSIELIENIFPNFLFFPKK